MNKITETNFAAGMKNTSFGATYTALIVRASVQWAK
jgi:hypothetical protein